MHLCPMAISQAEERNLSEVVLTHRCLAVTILNQNNRDSSRPQLPPLDVRTVR